MSSGLKGAAQTYEDTSFIAGDSPVTLNFSADLSGNSRTDADGYLICDGTGSITVSLSHNGTVFGDEMTVKNGEILHFLGARKLRITHIGTDSAYRVAVQHSEESP